LGDIFDLLKFNNKKETQFITESLVYTLWSWFFRERIYHAARSATRSWEMWTSTRNSNSLRLTCWDRLDVFSDMIVNVSEDHHLLASIVITKFTTKSKYHFQVCVQEDSVNVFSFLQAEKLLGNFPMKWFHPSAIRLLEILESADHR